MIVISLLIILYLSLVQSAAPKPSAWIICTDGNLYTYKGCLDYFDGFEKGDRIDVILDFEKEGMVHYSVYDEIYFCFKEPFINAV